MSAPPVPSKQEMFDRAWRGLRDQGWRRSVIMVAGRPQCVYYDKATGNRCAWGHVDPEGTAHICAPISVYGLSSAGGEGLAPRLRGNRDLTFAMELQAAHDLALEDGEQLQERMRQLAVTYGLTIPDEVTT